MVEDTRKEEEKEGEMDTPKWINLWWNFPEPNGVFPAGPEAGQHRAFGT